MPILMMGLPGSLPVRRVWPLIAPRRGRRAGRADGSAGARDDGERARGERKQNVDLQRTSLRLLRRDRG